MEALKGLKQGTIVGLESLANRATEFVGKGLSSLGVVNTGIPAIDHAYNAANIYKGTKNLEKQLERGNNFNDIYGAY